MKTKPKLIDLTGQNFGNWKVVKKSGNNKTGAAIWLCLCSCGRLGYPTGLDLRAGKSKSCGCSGYEAFHAATRTHGKSKTPLYAVWKAMRQRCNNPNDKGYMNYGGRGITVDHAWNDFEEFYSWAIGSGYDGTLTLERTDVNQGYSPKNCIWACRVTQSQNRRFILRDETGTPWCSIANKNGISSRLFSCRTHAGWTAEEASSIPKGARRKKVSL